MIHSGFAMNQRQTKIRGEVIALNTFRALNTMMCGITNHWTYFSQLKVGESHELSKKET